MYVKIKKLHKDAVIPKYAKEYDAGMDLTAISKNYDSENEVFSYGTGLAMEIPKGFVGLLFPRSSVYKKDLLLANSVGVIDSSYRGEIIFKFKIKKTSYNDVLSYNIGERIGQIIIIKKPFIEFIEVNKLSKTERNNTGFGSSGK